MLINLTIMGFDEDFTAHGPILVKSLTKSAQHTRCFFGIPVITSKIDKLYFKIIMNSRVSINKDAGSGLI